MAERSCKLFINKFRKACLQSQFLLRTPLLFKDAEFTADPVSRTCRSTSGPSPEYINKSEALLLLILPFPSASHDWKHSP